MTDWTWYLADGNRLVLAERTATGTILELAGVALFELSARNWPWWAGIHPRTRFNLGAISYHVGNGLLNSAERRTRTLVEVPVAGELADKLIKAGVIEKGEEEILPGVREVDSVEGARIFDDAARWHLGISGLEFLARWDNGHYPDVDKPAGVWPVAVLLPMVRGVSADKLIATSVLDHTPGGEAA